MPKSTRLKTEAQKSRIFLVEDHPVFRDGLSKLLNEEEDLAVCGEAGDARQGLKMITKLKPDLVVVDIGLPGKSGLELIKEIRVLKLPIKLLAVSMFNEAVYAQRVLRAGGDGYVMKQEDPEVIVLAIRDVLAGHIYVSEDVFATHVLKHSSTRKASSLDQLTDAELEILELLGLGKSIPEISQQLSSSDAEIKTHSKNIRRKLKLSNDNALISFAVGWVEDTSK